MAISSQYFAHGGSSLYLEPDGRCSPITEPKAIGSGSSYASYFLGRYWHPNDTTMEQFVQLSDFIIRYVSDRELPLDNAVGLSDQNDQCQYPQIIYIPDNPNFWRVYNNDQPKIDCSPHLTHLNEFRSNSKNMINSLHHLPPPWPDS